MDRDLNSQNEEQTSFGFFDIFRLIIRKGMNEEDAANSFPLKRTKKQTTLSGISFTEQKTLFLIVIKRLAGGLKKNFWSVIALAIALTVLHNCIISILWIIPHSPYSFASQSVISRFIFNFLSFFISVIIYIPFICLGRCFMEQRKAKYQDFSYKNISGNRPKDDELHWELKRLRQEVRILRQERDILKKATAFFARTGK